MLKRILIVVLILAAIAAGYWQLTAASRLRARIGSLAATEAQRRLWTADASPGTASTVDKLARPQPAAAPPLPLQRPGQPTPAAPLAPGAIPSGIANGIRIVSRLGEAEPDFTGQVAVIASDPSGERITLRLSPGREVSVAVRVAGKPLGVTTGSMVEFSLQWHPGIDERRQFVGIRTQSGIEIQSFLQAGPKPVTVKAPLLSGGTLIAEQSGTAFNNTMRLDVTGPNIKDSFEAPAERQYGERTLLVLASEAKTTPAVDGAPFGIELLTWRLK